MNNKILLGIIVLAVGGIAGWVFLGMGNVKTPAFPSSAPTTTSAPTLPSSGQKMVVTYTDTGFSPKTLTVKQGTTVEFVNASSQQMWVASGEHPTHKLLPGFDELGSVGRNGTYDYTFVKVGTWPLHNHMSPSDTGTIVVQ